MVKAVNRVFLATILISFLGYYINDWVLSKTDNQLITLLVSQIILILPSIFYIAINRLNIFKSVRFNRIRLSNIILIIIFAYLITPLMNLINAISMIYVRNDISDIMNNIVEYNGLFLSLFMIAFIPCVFEEFVYRGIFYNEYRKVNVIGGILLSGFLFGIMHGNINQFSYAFAMGIIFALLIEATDSILSTMIVHFFINGTSVVLISIYPKLIKLLESLYGKDAFNAEEMIATMESGLEGLNLEMVLKTFGPNALICTILAFLVYRTIAKNSGRWDLIRNVFKRNQDVYGDLVNDSSITELQLNGLSTMQKKRLITPSLAIGILICIFLILFNEFYIYFI